MTHKSVRKKKICFIMPAHWSSGLGGAEYQVKCMFDILLKNKQNKIYFLARRLDEVRHPEGYELIKIAKSLNGDKYGYFIDAFSLLKKLRKINPDIIYQRVGCAYTGIAAYFAKRKGCKMVWHISSEMDISRKDSSFFLKPHHCIEKAILEYGIKNTDIIIAQTNEQRKMLKTNYDKDAYKIIKNFHPIPEDATEIKPVSHIEIIWIGNFKPIKRPEIFIRLADEINKGHVNIKFTMIGKEASWLKHWQEELRCKINKIHNMNYLGKLSMEQVNERLEKAHILVNTSEIEGFPNTFIQAWMRGVPVVSLNCDPDGVITKNNIGVFAGNYKNLVKSLNELINNKEKIKLMGKRARSYALKEHSMENAKDLIKIFETL